LFPKAMRAVFWCDWEWTTSKIFLRFLGEAWGAAVLAEWIIAALRVNNNEREWQVNPVLTERAASTCGSIV
jgi:hypothetical protein